MSAPRRAKDQPKGQPAAKIYSPHPDLSLTVFKIPEAAAQLRMSKSKLYEEIAEGKIKICKRGKSSFVTGPELARYIAAL